MTATLKELCIMKNRWTMSLALAALAPLVSCAPSSSGDATGDPVASGGAQGGHDSGTPVVGGGGDDTAPGDDDLASDGGTSNPGDGASDAAADSGVTDGGTTAPPQLAGAVLWLESTRGVTVATEGGTAITGWKDQSTAHNDASQTTSDLQPTLITRSGLPAVELSGKIPATVANGGGTGGPWLKVKDAASLNWGVDDFTIAVVAAYHNPTDGSHLGAIGCFFGKWGKSAGQGQIMFAGNWPHAEHPNVEYSDLYFGFGEGVASIVTSKSTGFNDDQVRLYVAQRTSTGTVVRVSGKVIDTLASTSVTNVDSVGADVGIGNFGGDESARNLQGDVFAVIALHGTTSADDLSRLESYLMTTYPVTSPPGADGG